MVTLVYSVYGRVMHAKLSPSCVQLCATFWTTTCQAPISGFLQARALEWFAAVLLQEDSMRSLNMERLDSEG